MDDVIGRYSDINKLTHIYISYKSEYVAGYGRRRVGKTYMITTFGLTQNEHAIGLAQNQITIDHLFVKMATSENWVTKD